MDENTINEFLDIINDAGYDLDDLGLDEDDLDEMDVDDFNAIINSLPDDDDDDDD